MIFYTDHQFLTKCMLYGFISSGMTFVKITITTGQLLICGYFWGLEGCARVCAHAHTHTCTQTTCLEQHQNMATDVLFLIFNNISFVRNIHVNISKTKIKHPELW